MTKYDEQELSFILLDEGYSFDDVTMFVDDYAQNQNSLESNIIDFKEWLEVNESEE